MPLSYELTHSGRIVIIRGDFADLHEWRGILEEIASRWQDREGVVGILRDRRLANAPISQATIMSVVDLIADVWSGVRARGIAVLTARVHHFPEQIAAAVADLRGIPLQAFDSEDAALDWLNALLREQRDPTATRLDRSQLA